MDNFNQATLNVGGNTVNAQAIEHFILRKSASSMIKEVSSLYLCPIQQE